MRKDESTVDKDIFVQSDTAGLRRASHLARRLVFQSKYQPYYYVIPKITYKGLLMINKNMKFKKRTHMLLYSHVANCKMA